MTPSDHSRRGRLESAVDASWARLEALANHAAGYATVAVASVGVNFAAAAGCPPEVADEIERRLEHWRLAVGTLEEFLARTSTRTRTRKGIPER